MYVNGTSLGIHRGGYDAFSYDITDVPLPDGPQELIVRVYDPTNSRAIACGKQDSTERHLVHACNRHLADGLAGAGAAEATSLTLTPDVDNRLAVTVDVSDSAEHLMVQATAYYNGQEAGSSAARLAADVSDAAKPAPGRRTIRFCTTDCHLQRDGRDGRSVTATWTRKIEVKPVDGVNRIFLNDNYLKPPARSGHWPTASIRAH